MGKKDNGISLSGETGEISGQQILEQKKKKKRKKVILTVVIIVLVVLVLIIAGVAIAVAQAMKKMAGGKVTLAKPENGDIVSEITVTGNIESEQTIHYTSPSNLIVAEAVPAGSYVKKGDVILKFDENDYQVALRQLEINSKMTENTYQSSLSGEGSVRSKIAEAQADIDKYQAEVNEKQAKYDEYQAVVNRYEENGNLSNSQSAIQTQTAYEQANIAKCEAMMQELLEAYEMSPEYVALDNAERAKALAKFMSEGEYKELSDSLQNSKTIIANISKQSSDQNTDYTKASTEASKYKAEVETAKSKLEAAKTQLDTYKNQLGNNYDRENKSLQEELSNLQNEQSMNALVKYEKGLIAPFDGVVTAINYTVGDTATAGTPIATFSSLEDVHVSLGVGKTDLEKLAVGQDVTIKSLKNEYKGKVKTINHSAVQNGNAGAQVQVTVSIDNPDENIYLGLDAKCSILTASVEDVLTVPVEAVNVDDKGEFVFTFTPSTMMVGKKYVTTGVSSDLLIEITEGLEEGDIIVTDYTGVVDDGKMATPSAESQALISEEIGKK